MGSLALAMKRRRCSGVNQTEIDPILAARDELSEGCPPLVLLGTAKTMNASWLIKSSEFVTFFRYVNNISI